MENLKIFSDLKELDKYLNCNIVREVGNGLEGYTYLAKDGSLLKRIRHQVVINASIDSIITTSMFCLESFIFPDELYVCDKTVYGYKTRFFYGDVFCDTRRKESAIIDLEKLLKARNRMLEDIRILSIFKYKLNDLCGNLLFDGKRLAAIDTLSYSKDENITLKDNINSLDTAISYSLHRLDDRIIDWDIPLTDKIKRLIYENNTSLIEAKPLKF